MTARVRPYRPDAQLAALTARGDSAAFGELVARHTRPLSGVLHRHAWALDLVERDDMRQEALLGYWLACETFDRAWGILFPTYGDRFAGRRIMHLVRAAQTRKALLNRDAVSLDSEQPAQDGEQPGTLEETVPAAEYWQPEVMSEIRRELRTLAAELPGELSSTEREALGRVMLDEKLTDTRVRNAATRVRQKASGLLGYEWAPRRRDDRRQRAQAMLAAGRSQREIAKTLGVSQTTVRNWSAGDELARAA
jgi:RNA polymerase sigma factor (sigma-70 family)